MALVSRHDPRRGPVSISGSGYRVMVRISRFEGRYGMYVWPGSFGVCAISVYGTGTRAGMSGGVRRQREGGNECVAPGRESVSAGATLYPSHKRGAAKRRLSLSYNHFYHTPTERKKATSGLEFVDSKNVKKKKKKKKKKYMHFLCFRSDIDVLRKLYKRQGITAHWYRRLWSKSQTVYFTHIDWIIFCVLKVYRKPWKTRGNSWCLLSFICALLEVHHVITRTQ